MQSNLKRGCRGSTMLEFAFVLLPLLAVVLGSIEFDRMLLAYTSLGNAARAGLRYAIVHGQYADGAINATTTNNIGQRIQSFSSLGMIDTSGMTITESCTNGTGPYIHICYEDGTNAIGSRVSVKVSYPYVPLTGFFPWSLTLSSTAKGTIAF